MFWLGWIFGGEDGCRFNRIANACRCGRWDFVFVAVGKQESFKGKLAPLFGEWLG